MDDNLFPSGPWTGFYNYTGPEDRHRMDLYLTFAGGRMDGNGNDDVGMFLVSGGYDVHRRECDWTKTYPGSHCVSYCGFREGDGIWGTWEIQPWLRGGFHIWPRRVGEGEDAIEAVKTTFPKEVEVMVPVMSPGSGEVREGGI